MALEDRAWTMHATLEPYVDLPGRVALIASHGLYLDQATALRSAMPRLDPSGLWFAIGHDKAVQIFDPRYYEDRDSALDALFTLAGLLVAPRSDATSDELLTLVRRPDNKRFADRVRPIALPPQVARLSSTAVRAGLTAGQSLLPSPVAAMIAARQCYA
jgi:nicotinic acid mononucleotide adenylyltransferase